MYIAWTLKVLKWLEAIGPTKLLTPKLDEIATNNTRQLGGTLRLKESVRILDVRDLDNEKPNFEVLETLEIQCRPQNTLALHCY